MCQLSSPVHVGHRRELMSACSLTSRMLHVCLNGLPAAFAGTLAVVVAREWLRTWLAPSSEEMEVFPKAPMLPDVDVLPPGGRWLLQHCGAADVAAQSSARRAGFLESNAVKRQENYAEIYASETVFGS